MSCQNELISDKRKIGNECHEIDENKVACYGDKLTSNHFNDYLLTRQYALASDA